MKIQFSLAALLLCSGSLYAKEITTKSTQAEQVGYSFGYLIGRSNIDALQGIDLDAFSQGLKAAAAGQNASISDEEMARVLSQFKRQSEAKELIQLKQQADENAKIGQAFLKENAKKPGVKTTKSGLQYVVLQEGKASHRLPTAMSGCIMKAVYWMVPCLTARLPAPSLWYFERHKLLPAGLKGCSS